MTTLSSLERSKDVQKRAPVITRTLLTLSDVRVRNVATVGGAVAHGDPHMDLPPVLMALGASVTIAGPGGERSVPIEERLPRVLPVHRVACPLTWHAIESMTSAGSLRHVAW